MGFSVILRSKTEGLDKDFPKIHRILRRIFGVLRKFGGNTVVISVTSPCFEPPCPIADRYKGNKLCRSPCRMPGVVCLCPGRLFMHNPVVNRPLSGAIGLLTASRRPREKDIIAHSTHGNFRITTQPTWSKFTLKLHSAPAVYSAKAAIGGISCGGYRELSSCTHFAPSPSYLVLRPV